MTKWQSIFLARNERKQCHCFDCLRARGITVPLRPDCLGLFRDERDGRFTLALQHFEKGKDGEAKTVIDQKRQYIGT